MKRSIQLVALLLTVFMGSCTGVEKTKLLRNMWTQSLL